MERPDKKVGKVIVKHLCKHCEEVNDNYYEGKRFCKKCCTLFGRYMRFGHTAPTIRPSNDITTFNQEGNNLGYAPHVERRC